MYRISASNSYKYRKIAFWALISGIVLASVLYGYSINAAVYHVVSEQKIERTITNLTPVVSDLEYKNISLKNSITMDRAKMLGFEEENSVVFVNRTAGLSFNSR